MNTDLDLARRSRLASLLGAASLGVLAATAFAAPAHAQDAAATAPAQEEAAGPGAESSTAEEALEAGTDGGEIVVTGFRRSLAEALNVKRESVSAVDAIVAEDIAKFPDQNLAESLQRIPGISIQRDAGEGRSITVRGLGSQFTRVRVNGLETVATSTDGASANRDRSFDFNVFASELFNSIVVHKTAEASLDEGSLGAVVDLNTGNPLGGKEGFTMVASVQGTYNTLSEDLGPRLAGLVSWKSPNGDFGVAVSAAYQQNRTLELGNNTVRWQQARFDSVGGTPCFVASATNATPRPNTGGVYRPSANCDAVALAFHPRIPRYGEISHNRDRLGLTASVQWSPSEATKVSVDGLFSRFKADRGEKYAEVLFRGNERSIDVVNFQIDPATNNLVKGTFNDAWVRTENYFRQSETQFYQLGASWDQDVTDTFRFTLLGGFSKSDASIPLETTLIFDDRDAQNYQYDYTNSRRPVLTFGTSVTEPSVFQLAEIRDRPSDTVNKFRTLNLRTEYDVTDGFQVKLGGVYRRFNFDTEGFTRDTIVCPNRTTNGPDVVLGTITCTPQSGANAVFGPNAVYGFPVTANLAELFRLRRAGAPQGTTTEWLIPNRETSAAFTGLYSRPLAVDAGNTRAVQEEVKGGYLQFDFKGDMLGLRYAANAGVRYVNTDQASTGLSNGQIVTIDRSYDDWLPAVNVAFFPTEDIVLRFAASDVLTRPSLGNLTPGGSVDGFNYRVSFGNPFLEPFRASAYDAAFEWYFAPQSIFSVALFKKDVESFPISSTRSGTYASTGLPLSLIPPSSPAASNPEGQLWTINTIVNGTGASLKGAEVSLQAPFRFLPGFLSNFGGIVNATFVDSDAVYTVSGPAVVPGGALISETRTATLFGLSKRAYNGTLYYEDDKFSARVSASYRSGFLDATSGTGNVFEGYNSTINVDASMRYRLTEALEFSVEGINLTDEYRDRFADVDANRNYEYNHFGRTILFGVRYKM
jgi:TonB-dependent receptor